MIDLGSQSEAPLVLLDAVADGTLPAPRTAWHCCLEFYSVTTRLPEEYRLAPEIAVRFVEEQLLTLFEVDALPEEHRQTFLSSAAADGVAGGRIYDVHIAEIARLSGATTVVTENRRHFTGLLRYGVRVLLSAEMVDNLQAK